MSTLETVQPTVADAIENTLEWLDKQGCGAKDQERRHTRRSRYRVVARITYMPAGSQTEQSFEVTTRNLSRTGLSFLHQTLIYPRQLVEVRLPLPDHSVAALQGKVVRVRSAGAGWYEIGVEYTAMELNVIEPGRGGSGGN